MPDLTLPEAGGSTGAHVQCKLAVSQPGDPQEQEADRIASIVTRGEHAAPRASASALQRKCTQCDIEEKVQRKCTQCEEPTDDDEGDATVMRAPAGPRGVGSPGPDTAAKIASSRASRGAPLAPHLRNFFEPRLGADLSRVRVHRGEAATAAARALRARAFTVGPDVFFPRSEWQPHSRAGRELLAHELVHTVQQGGAPRRRDAPLRVGAHGSLFERAADCVAKSTIGPAAPEIPLFHSSARPDKLGSTPLAPRTARQVHSVTSRSGRELPAAVRLDMESHLGADLSQVRVHSDGSAAQMSRALGTRAFTLGKHLVFGRGQFQPQSTRGRALLAHELAHTLQPGGSDVIWRAPPQDGAPKLNQAEEMQRILTLTYNDKGDEVTTADLSHLESFRLEIVLNMAIAKMKEHLRNVKSAPNERSSLTFEQALSKATGLAKRVQKLQGLRENIEDSTEFVANARAVLNSGISGDVQCFFNIAIPRIPKYLKALHRGTELGPTEDDQIYAGYISSRAAVFLTDGRTEINGANFYGATTVLPRQLARTFYASGANVDELKSEVLRQYKFMNDGIIKMGVLEETLGAGTGDTPITKVMGEIDRLGRMEGTLYSCNPIHDGWLGGQTSTDKKRQEKAREAAAAGATSALDALPDQLIPKFQVDTQGVGPVPDWDGDYRVPLEEKLNKAFERFE